MKRWVFAQKGIDFLCAKKYLNWVLPSRKNSFGFGILKKSIINIIKWISL